MVDRIGVRGSHRAAGMGVEAGAGADVPVGESEVPLPAVPEMHLVATDQVVDLELAGTAGRGVALTDHGGRIPDGTGTVQAVTV